MGRKGRKRSTPLQLGHLCELLTKLCHVQHKWFDIGLQLDLHDGVLKIIEKQHPDPRVCFREMLTHWLKRGSPHPTKQALIKALCSETVGEERLAHDLVSWVPPSNSLQPTSVANRVGFSLLWPSLLLVVVVVVSSFFYQGPSNGPSKPAIHYESSSLPPPTEVFLGREEEMENLTKLLDFHSSSVRIVTIVGSPGFGKSTLAIHIGHKFMEKGEVQVHYIDLYDVSNIFALKEKFKLAVEFHPGETMHDPLLQWAKQLKANTLLIFDNCDDVLFSYQDDFQGLIKSLIEQYNSNFLKVLLTAKQETLFLGPHFQRFTLHELDTTSAADVLQRLSDNLNRKTAKQVAHLVGRVPLALQVVGALLKVVPPSSVITQLSRDPIPTLSPEELHSLDRVATTLNASYWYLTAETQFCAQNIANFPGSFDEKALQYILRRIPKPFDVIDVSRCLRVLQQRSLLSTYYDNQKQRYRFHQLIRQFFLYIQRLEGGWTGGELQRAFFLSLFGLHYRSLFWDMLNDALPWQTDSNNYTQLSEKNISEHLHTLDSERINFDLVFHLRTTLQTNIWWNLLIDRLEFNEAVESFSRKTFELASEYASSDPFQYLIDATIHPSLAPMVRYLWETQVALVQQILIQYDGQFTLIERFVGMSTYFETYVKLLIHLSNLKRLLYGFCSHAVETLMSRHTRVAELYSYAASANNSASRRNYVTYYSALARNYILLDQYDRFIDCWQGVLQLRTELSKCNHRKCSSVYLGLAYFGLGKYEKAIQYLESNVHSQRLSINKRAKLFVLLYESYSRTGNSDKAEQLVKQDGFLSINWEFRQGTAFSDIQAMLIHSNQTMLSSSIAWELWWNTEVDYKNYITFFILGSFYKHLNIQNATTAGEVLTLVGSLYDGCYPFILYTLRYITSFTVGTLYYCTKYNLGLSETMDELQLISYLDVSAS